MVQVHLERTKRSGKARSRPTSESRNRWKRPTERHSQKVRLEFGSANPFQVEGLRGTDFLPYVRSTFAAKVKTKSYYENGVKSLLADPKLAGRVFGCHHSEKVAGYVAKRQEAGLQVASINRELQVLRRMFHLAQEWGKVEKVLPRVRMLSGERHRERVLTAERRETLLGRS